jgi:hypothetical protein
MIATTIMISTRVKPALRMFLVCFILVFFLCWFYGGTKQQAGLYDYDFVPLIACCNRIWATLSNVNANVYNNYSQAIHKWRIY